MSDAPSPPTGEALCTHIASTINGDDIHTCGVNPSDAFVDGHTHATAVLATIAGRQRWFKVNVEEIYPEHVSVLLSDHDGLVALARYVGMSQPIFRGPSSDLQAGGTLRHAARNTCTDRRVEYAAIS
jgi:hypothetical protein